jgi:hypothetical protein
MNESETLHAYFGILEEQFSWRNILEIIFGLQEKNSEGEKRTASMGKNRKGGELQ